VISTIKITNHSINIILGCSYILHQWKCFQNVTIEDDGREQEEPRQQSLPPKKKIRNSRKEIIYE